MFSVWKSFGVVQYGGDLCSEEYIALPIYLHTVKIYSAFNILRHRSIFTTCIISNK